MDTCTVYGCDKLAIRFGLCGAHYQRKRRHGSPLKGGTAYGVVHRWAADHASYTGRACLKWPFSTCKSGYGTARVNGRTITANHYMCELAHGRPPPGKPFATHVCGNGHKGCVNPKHLRWASAKQNQMDRARHGTSNRGERCGSAKLSRDDVYQIRRLIERGAMLKDIASKYSVNPITISDIKTGRTWAWLMEENGNED